MPNYRRRVDAGGTFFFTVVTHDQKHILDTPEALGILRRAIATTRTDHPFLIDAMVVLPEHLHAIWTMPDRDGDYSMRWKLIKARFTREFLRNAENNGGIASRPTWKRQSRGERAVWQQRFWEHVIRDEDDLARHLDYIHYNPVKHELATCPHAWEASSFRRAVSQRIYEHDWCCACSGPAKVPDFSWAVGLE